jgi:hypothetical protein
MADEQRFPATLTSLGASTVICALAFAAFKTTLGFWIIQPGFFILANHLTQIFGPFTLLVIGLLLDVLLYAAVLYAVITIKMTFADRKREAE